MAAAHAGPSAAPATMSNLTALLPAPDASAGSTTSARVHMHPSPDALLGILHARARADIPYTALGARACVVVNPLRALASAGDESARRAMERAARTDGSGGAGGEGPAGEGEGKPGPYEMAGRVWSLMRRRGEDQGVVFSGPTHSGKTYTSRLFTTQLLRLSASSPGPNGTFRFSRPALQFQALHTVLDAFGHAKTAAAADASQHARYLELAFHAGTGAYAGAQVLAFGLAKSRVVRLEREERTFHVFYQLLAGASPAERDAHGLLDPAEYALLASSGTYRLPGGPAADDAVQFDELRAALACLGFKSKHLQSLFNILSCILLLGNLRFADAASGLGDASCTVDAESRALVDDVARRLGLDGADLEGALTNETRWVRGSAGGRKELCSVVLDARGAERQRDSLVRDVYAILFAFVVETGNRKVAPAPPASAGDGNAPPALHTIAQLDIPGYRSRSQAPADPRASQYSQTLVSTQGENGIDEFCANFANELVHAYVARRAFDDDGDVFAARAVQDGIALPRVVPLDNAACVELLRGGLVGDNALGARPGGLCGLLDAVAGKSNAKETADEAVRRDSRLVDDMIRAFGVQGSLFVAGGATRSTQARTSFGINHYSGPITYDAKDFVEHNTDVLDAQFVGLLRTSTDTFVSKLVSGPAIAAECHPKDDATIVQAQVAVVPLRDPAGLNGASEVPLTSLLEQGVAHPLSTQYNATMTMLLNTLDSARLWQFICIRPNESGYPGSFDKRRVKHQITASLLPDLVVRCQTDFVADLDLEEFCGLHGLRLGSSPADSVREFADRKEWVEGKHYSVGQRRIWFTYVGWRMADDIVRNRLGDSGLPLVEQEMDMPRLAAAQSDGYSEAGQSRRSAYRGQPEDAYGESVDDLLIRRVDTRGSENVSAAPGRGFGGYEQPPIGMHDNPSGAWESEYDQKSMGNHPPPVLAATYPPEKAPLHAEDLNAKEAEAAGMVIPSKHKTEVEVVPTTRARRWWVRITWLLTWWVPSFMLSWMGRMKRPDIRMAWREKLAIFMMIVGMCGVVIFYIVVFGRLLCPNSDKAWNTSELAQHAGTNDYYAAVAGKVYDFTKFYKIQHSDINAYPTSASIMLEFAGQDLTNYFPVPFTVACPGLVSSTALYMQKANFTPTVAYAIHTSGPLQTVNNTKLNDINWYYDRFSPYVEQYYKGQYVWDKNDVQRQADDSSKIWAIYKNNLYDLSDYFATIDYYKTSSGEGVPNYEFLNSGMTDLFKQQPGTDITKEMDQVFSSMTADEVQQQLTCLNNAFYLGVTDFRKTARCTVQNYLLLAFSILLMSTIFAKFLAALQLGSKRQPELLDKFVICQVPCYTEGEESLRRTIDSLAGLRYDDKRKLMFIICDGNIIGSGNDRTTPRIVLDILGVDPKLDPEPLLFKSIGEGAKQLNYGKVYSGLYEFEGHVVPYMVVVKVGKPSERSKPGNRGKRDSQVLLLHYLNRVHFDAPMNPLELEIFHQMRNIIGIDPAFYEYIFQVDADTTVTPDSLNRMIACASDDQRIIGICGETKLANERQSLTTMIQVYEYYISHHQTKAFESLFGSVTCLPGCFSVYRIRTADKGRPIIISSRVIDEYSEPNVDTLHKKNLFSLGEDRYLTTLMMKHFPTFKMKFTPDAIAHTVAPDKWSILISQRRRWINSTIHNLVELLFLPEMCGFCFFSMRFIVFVDLLGTIILPATCVYLIYLIVVVSTGKAAVPIISIAMIAAVYGLQALIFILKREFMLVGWMIIYILAFPIYSFFLPLYSFWSMDDFSWGSTRLVVGDGNNKKVISDADDHFDDSMIPLKRFSEYEAETWETASAVHSEHTLRDDEKSSVAGSGRRNLGRRPPPMSGQASANNLGDYYRDGSAIGPGSQRHLREVPSSSSLHSGSDIHNAQAPRYRSMAGLSQWGAGSQYGGGGGIGAIHNPFLGGTPGGSAYGAPDAPMASQTHLNNPYGMMGNPRNTMMPMMSDFNGSNPFMGSGMQQAPAGRPQTLNPRISTFSFATTANPFAGAAPPAPSSDPDPSDDDIVRMVSDYLATKDLMTVTKRKVREGVMALFPEADLTDKTTLINESIDRLLTA